MSSNKILNDYEKGESCLGIEVLNQIRYIDVLNYIEIITYSFVIPTKVGTHFVLNAFGFPLVSETKSADLHGNDNFNLIIHSGIL